MFFEDNTFEILSLEHDIFYENIRLDSLKYSIMEDIYTENGNSAFDRFKKFIGSVVEKIKSFFKKVKDAISDFFTHKNINDKLNDLEKDIKENPELGKQKVKVHDYTKLEQLNDQAISDLNHRVEATEKIMEKYRKRRNGIIAAGIAITTLTFSAAVAMAKNVENICNIRLRQKTDQVTDQINSVNERIDGVQRDISEVSTRMNNQESQISKNKEDINEIKYSINDIKNDTDQNKKEISDNYNKLADAIIHNNTAINKIKENFREERKEHLLDLSSIKAELDGHAITTEQIQRYLKEEQKLLKAYTELMSDNSKYSVALEQRCCNIINKIYEL